MRLRRWFWPPFVALSIVDHRKSLWWCKRVGKWLNS
nr:MAG TPA: hypothetical protein [Caudoviricetes sp.]